MAVIIKLEGFNVIEKGADQAIKNALVASALVVERAAKINAPYQHGDLSRSIKSEMIKKTSNGYAIAVSPSVHYAEYMERPGRVRKRGIRPYMKPALFDNQLKIKQIFEDELGNLVKRGGGQ